jgi:hypothetical protein
MRVRMADQGTNCDPVIEPPEPALAFLLAYELSNSIEITKMLSEWISGARGDFPADQFLINMTSCVKEFECVKISCHQDNGPRLETILPAKEMICLLKYWMQVIPYRVNGFLPAKFLHWEELQS